MKGQRFERGQALVLIVLSVVAIFGFAALAVDMGRVYAERRRAQSAADAAALSAAYTVADTVIPASDPDFDTKMADLMGEAKNIAVASALENGYAGVKEDYEAGITNYYIEVKNPPDDAYDPATDKGTHYEECSCKYFQVKIHSKVNPIFMQFIGRGNSEITTVAVARARFSQPISTGDAIHALLMEDEQGDGIVVDGNFTLNIQHGNVRTNKNGVKNGNGTGSLTVEKGYIYTTTGWENPNGVSARKIYQGMPPLIVPTPPRPDCGNDEGKVDESTGLVKPGNFNGLTLGPRDWKMNPGMYCLNGDFKINGGASVKGDGVFIVMQSGKLTIDGNATVQWKRPNNLLDKSKNQWGGMLIYVVPPANGAGTTGDVNLTGTSGSSFMGTVFSPRGMCEYGGNNQFETITSFQLVCRQVKLNGNPNVGINYIDEEGYRMPPIVELVK